MRRRRQRRGGWAAQSLLSVAREAHSSAAPCPGHGRVVSAVQAVQARSQASCECRASSLAAACTALTTERPACSLPCCKVHAYCTRATGAHGCRPPLQTAALRQWQGASAAGAHQGLVMATPSMTATAAAKASAAAAAAATGAAAEGALPLAAPGWVRDYVQETAWWGWRRGV